MTLEELYRLLRSNHVQAQGIVDTLQEPLVVLDRSLTVVNANPAFFRTFRAERDETLGHHLFELGNGQWDIKEFRELLAEVVPKAQAIVGYKVTHDFPDIGQRTMLLTARRLQHPDENSTQILLAFEDVTERYKADAEKDILLAETRHRMKNLFAILRAVANQTGTEGRSTDQYREAFVGRFEAVLNAQLLVSYNGSEAELGALINRALQPIAGPRAEVVPGPFVSLAQHQILPVSMMLHELATNAVKHGALSDTSEVIHITWEVEDREGAKHVLLDWREEGGPPVSPPSRRGFGTSLIEHGVKAEGGKVEFNFAAEGLRARLALPVAQ